MDNAWMAYRFLAREFVVTHEEEIRSCSVNELLLPALCKEIAAELNQEFLRARYGGMYNTTSDCREIYFRISSIGFEWKEIICRFLTDVKFHLRTQRDKSPSQQHIHS